MSIIRAQTLQLPLRDESVDLIITSPPYFALRSYRDGGEHYDGQIGSEPSPAEFVERLWAATAEMIRHTPPPCSACWADGSWEEGLPRLATRVPAGVNRLRCLGNAVVPQVAELIGRRAAAHIGGEGRTDGGSSPTNEGG